MHLAQWNSNYELHGCRLCSKSHLKQIVLNHRTTGTTEGHNCSFTQFSCCKLSSAFSPVLSVYMNKTGSVRKNTFGLASKALVDRNKIEILWVTHTKRQPSQSDSSPKAEGSTAALGCCAALSHQPSSSHLHLHLQNINGITAWSSSRNTIQTQCVGWVWQENWRNKDFN